MRISVGVADPVWWKQRPPKEIGPVGTTAPTDASTAITPLGRSP